MNCQLKSRWITCISFERIKFLEFEWIRGRRVLSESIQDGLRGACVLVNLHAVIAVERNCAEWRSSFYWRWSDGSLCADG